MTETFDLDFDGIPAGSGIIHETPAGFAFLWTRPDAQVICRSGFESAEACGKALTAEVIGHYGRMQ